MYITSSIKTGQLPTIMSNYFWTLVKISKLSYVMIFKNLHESNPKDIKLSL